MKRKKLSENAYNWILLLMSALLMILFISFHEPWRDEAQAWLISKQSIPDIFRTLKSEGHPILWFLILHPFSSLGCPYNITLHTVSFVFTIAAVYLLLFKTELSPVVKAVLVLSPTVVFQFGTISRVYAVCLFLMVALAVLHKDRDKKPILYALLNALLMQTHVQVEGFALGVGLVYLIETITAFKEKKPVGKRIIGLVIMFISGLLLIAELCSTLQTNTDITQSNPTVFENLQEYIIWYVTPLVFVLFFCIFTKTDWKCNLIQGFSVGWIFLVSAFVYYANCQRVCLLSVSVLFSFVNMKPFEKKGYWKYIPVLFGISTFCSVTLLSAAVSDITDPYSCARETAEYIDTHFNSETDVVISIQRGQNATISVWLKDKKLLYDTIEKDAAGFSDFGQDYLLTRDIDDILEDDFVKNKNVYFLYADFSKAGMIASSISNIQDLNDRVELVTSFQGSLTHEDFEIYRLTK